MRPRTNTLALLCNLLIIGGLMITACGSPHQAEQAPAPEPAATEAAATEAAATEPATTADAQPAARRVGFDVDDTLLFSSPAFTVAESTPGVERRSDEFWTIVNSSDEGHSVVKQKTLEILKAHQANGDQIFAVTARHPPGGDGLRAFLETTFGISGENVYFETEGKAERLRQLGIEVFYGDSDGDISAAIDAGAEPVRILRSPKSSYKKHYNPGSFDERIIAGSEE